MKFRAFQRAAFRQTLVAAAMLTAFATASAQTFTFSPAGAGLAGEDVTADNILISDYSRVTFSDATHFSETGYLQVSSFQLGDTTFTPADLNKDAGYSLYFAFTGTGHLTLGTAATVSSAPSAGEFDTLTYDFIGVNGNSKFDLDAGNNPTVANAGAPVTLASGSLIEGGVGSSFAGAGRYVPSAAATVSFATVAGGFFAAPVPFYDIALTAFTNTRDQVILNADGFSIKKGGGAVNFTSAIPEPETYALMLAGLGAIGFVARRRRT